MGWCGYRSDKAQQFRGVNGNKKVYLPAPANRSGKWVVLCHVLGFRPFKKSMAYDNAAEFDGASVGSGEAVIIPLPLERVRKGDYIEMEGVKFFNNAALFTPGSERELNELVAMMEENPGYNIRLHGHTNGNQSRDIVSLGSSTDFFVPSVSNEKIVASAKELSLLRAELVKAYLVTKGIGAERISTKGEGGKQMIFDPKGTLAGLNDRVEVEIRKH
jgi:outer membrane protein OmpA-like peptidoglycan-associated protein